MNPKLHWLTVLGFLLFACNGTLEISLEKTPVVAVTQVVGAVTASATAAVVSTATLPQTTVEPPTVLPTVTVAPPEATPTATSALATHVVQQGETLFRIALKYGVTVGALRAANGISGDTIFAGQVLIVPNTIAIENAPTALPPGPTAAPATGQPSATASPVSAVQWDTSPNALIVYHEGGWSMAGACIAANYYIPDVKLWGDGRIIWAKTGGPARQIFEGRLTSDQMRSLLQRIVDAGFFEWQDRYDALGGNSWTPRRFQVNLVGRSKEISEHGAAPPAFYELQNFIKSGAGADGHAFVPARGYLTVVPVPGEVNGEPWPDAAIVGFTLDRVGEGRYIEGEALTFVWNLVNRNPQSCVSVKSNEQVYWVSVQIPELSLK